MRGSVVRYVSRVQVTPYLYLPDVTTGTNKNEDSENPEPELRCWGG